MKLTQAVKTFETNADFTSQDFTIGDVSVVIEILRNKLYHHKVRTLVQEYISNARDAMREVNNKTDRIEVTVPTIFQPTLKVRDFGLGINPDRMYNVFIKYASSTKRKDNLQTGGFGIGAKSAWSYTESFTIVTYIDGVQRTYIAHIGANNNGRLDYLGECSTDAANGTEIQIPVSPGDVYNFQRAVLRATYFWNEIEKPVIKGLSETDRVEYIQGKMIGNLEINHKLPDFIAPSWGKGVVIAIDGIPYFAETGSIINKTKSLPILCDLVNGRLIIHVNNGELEVSASREEISDSKLNIDSLETIGQGMVKEVIDKIKLAFSKVKTPFEHLSIYMSLNNYYNLSSHRTYGEFQVTDKNAIQSPLFKNVKIESVTMHSTKVGALDKTDLNKSGRRRRNRETNLDASLFDHLFFTDGTETAIITNYRIKAYLQNNESVIIMTCRADDKTNSFDTLKKGLGFKDLKTINFTKPVRKSKEVIKIDRTKQEFCIRDLGRHSRQSTYITLEKNTTKWLYVEYKLDMDTSALNELAEYLEDYNVCALSQDAMRRVKGDKNFKPLSEYLKNYTVSNKDISSLKWNSRKHCDIMEKLAKLSGLQDKFLVDMVNEYKSHKHTHLIPALLKTAIGKVDEVDQFKIDDTALGQELKKYSLLDLITWSNSSTALSDIVLYINTKYKENKNV